MPASTYPTGTARARLCRAEPPACSMTIAPPMGVPHRKCGKLVVAPGRAELARLESIEAPGPRQTGVEGLEPDRTGRGRQRRLLEPAGASPARARACRSAGDRQSSTVIPTGRRCAAISRITAGQPIRVQHKGSSAWRPPEQRLDGPGLRRTKPPNRSNFDWPWSIAGRARGATPGRRGPEGYPRAQAGFLVVAAPGVRQRVAIFQLRRARPVFSRLVYPVPIPGRSRRALLDASTSPGRHCAFGPGCGVDRARELRCGTRAPARGGVLPEHPATIGRTCRNGSLLPDYAGIQLPKTDRAR